MSSQPSRAAAPPQPPRLLDLVRQVARPRFGQERPGERYAHWTHLTDLAANGHIAASTQNQAFHALLFLYQQVLGIELPRLKAPRAKRPKRLPTVLSPEEVRCFLDALHGGDGLDRRNCSRVEGDGCPSMNRDEGNSGAILAAGGTQGGAPLMSIDDRDRYAAL